MATVTVILGLCGSGKTTFAKQLAAVSVFDEGVAPGWPKHEAFLDALADGKDCAIVEVAYCFASVRDDFVRETLRRHPETRFNWVCFENDVQGANANCRADARRSPELVTGNIDQNERMARDYTYPAGAIVLRIGRSSQVNSREMQTCDECGSGYFPEQSRMAKLCPECAHLLYGYPTCAHEFYEGRCTTCGWDGSRSEYLQGRS